MSISHYLTRSLDFCIKKLQQQKIIAYPTESVFGLGCDPDVEKTVMDLLTLKQRSIEKGLILIAANYKQLKPYVADSKLTISQRKQMFSNWPGHITYVVPASPHTPNWLTGNFNSLAIRVSNHPDVQAICYGFGKPLISTSANLSGKPSCRNVKDLIKQFGTNIAILDSKIGGCLNPSEIRDLVSGKIIRQG
ncbi:Sua5/YciO/YrdC/YwlC family protein [Pantoea sp. Aalb]|uniref:Sua5/YciO/YrdC/YwlC family protein n=1 Tax=Pantoea sp. Aalb TaxID=2576762 RepID=UPI001325E1A4|nr:Sua5/YciO/YrdC/YwlC family protein [Pantoea sp. Aalb]MXP67911.1 L-threonylcarbamoyladenylate synthase type 1 TsaC [Pantoea sp. Aalb]